MNQTLYNLIKRKDMDLLKDYLLTHKDALNKPTYFSLTPLHLAILENAPEVVKFLLELGADPNQADAIRNTPLHLAMNYQNYELVKMLVDRGADPDRENIFGERALACPTCKKSYGADYEQLFLHITYDDHDWDFLK